MENEVEDELNGDKEENETDGLVHVFEVGDVLHDEGVEGSETHNGTHTGGPDDVWIVGDTEDSRDRIDGEDDVGEFNDNQDEERHEVRLLSLTAGAQVAAVRVHPELTLNGQQYAFNSTTGFANLNNRRMATKLLC